MNRCPAASATRVISSRKSTTEPVQNATTKARRPEKENGLLRVFASSWLHLGSALPDGLPQIVDRHQASVDRRNLLYVELQPLNVVVENLIFLDHGPDGRVRRRRIELIRFNKDLCLWQVGDEHAVRVIASLEMIDIQ